MTESLLQRLHDALQPHYSVQDQLGEGGMAVVFRGYDRSLERDVAIKVLRPELATARGAERFRREARLIAQISHPNVIPIHEVGEADGLSYYVMDLVRGDSLDRRLSGGPLATEEAVAVACQVLAALEAAHARGVIHRDIKPGNIFLSGGRVLVGDFGIAKRITRPDSTLTVDGEVPGTPGYMSPEQSVGDVHPAIDVYAVGMVVYEALTGHKWRPGADPSGAELAGVPRRVTQAVRKALAPAPRDRYQSAAAFRAALLARSRVPALAIVALVLAGLALVVWRACPAPDLPPVPEVDDLALLPCESDVPNPRTDSLAEMVGLQAGRMLRDLPRPRLVDPKRAASWWRRRAPAKRTVAAAARMLRADMVAECTLTRSDDSVTVAVRLFDREGVQQPGPPSVRGLAVIPPTDLARRVALGILEKTAPDIVLSGSSGWAALADHDEEAVRTFLIGELAFNRDDLDRAALHFSNALEHDSTLALARWRLAEAQRWSPQHSVEVDLDRLYREHADDLGSVDRRLLEAAIAPRGHEQLAKYEQLIADDPNDAYPVLLFADELFHRGPLIGIGLDSALVVLERAARLDSSLAPTYTHLAWLQIRLGQPEDSRATLNHLKRLAADTLPPSLPALLEAVHVERFQPDAAAAIRDELYAPVRENLRVLQYARYPLSFGLPEAQREFGRRLTLIPGSPRETRISGHIAQGAALFSMGRPNEGTAHFDSVARIAGGGPAALQAEQWRVLPHALGYAGASSQAVRRGRAALASLTDDETADPALRGAAAWTLVLLAARDGDIGGAERRLSSLADHASASGDSALYTLAEAVVAAGRGDIAGALEMSAPLAAYDSVAILRRPFERAALHLLRGEWHSDEGRSGAADGEWLWYDNLDRESFPEDRLQAADVDWALGTYGRVLRARLALTSGNAERACALASDALRYLANPEQGSAWLASEASGIRDASCAGREGAP